MLRKTCKNLVQTAILTFTALACTTALASDISIGSAKSNRFGNLESLATNWSTLHSNPTNNTYQETVRVMPVCVNGRSFVVTLGMAGVWDTSTNAGAGAGGGAGIVQVFDANSSGALAAVACK